MYKGTCKTPLKRDTKLLKTSIITQKSLLASSSSSSSITKMSSEEKKKIVVVFGATGNQGGSVINSLLSDSKTANEFKIRGITRDPSKANAKALEARGVECVAGDTNDKESLKHAFQGAYAVFAVTNYWEKMDAELEYNQGKSIADLAKVYISTDLLTRPHGMHACMCK